MTSLERLLRERLAASFCSNFGMRYFCMMSHCLRQFFSGRNEAAQALFENYISRLLPFKSRNGGVASCTSCIPAALLPCSCYLQLTYVLREGRVDGNFSGQSAVLVMVLFRIHVSIMGLTYTDLHIPNLYMFQAICPMPGSHKG